MMRAAVRRIHSPDVHDLASWRTTDEKFAILLQLMVGPVDGPGEESFDLIVCSPAHLAERARQEGSVWLRHVLVVERWDWDVIRHEVDRRVSVLDGETWTDVASRLSRWAQWEFEDHQE